MKIDELHGAAAGERRLQSQWHVGVGDADVQKSVWQQTLKEVEIGALVERPRLHTLHTIAALCMSLIADPWSEEQWKSRFFDLKGAYRQCAVNPPSACFAYIAVFDPTAKTAFAFRMRALPLGSVKSVHSFLCVAHSLWAILVKEFKVAWTNYFDDFVTFSTADEVASVAGSIKFVFKALGWVFAEDGDKAVDLF